MLRSDFHFTLPEELIAQKPLERRDASRLLCLTAEHEQAVDRRFPHLLDLVNDNDLLVMNNTRVIPARLFGQKSSGGKVEVLLERILDERRFLAQVRASKAPKPGTTIVLDDDYQLEARAKML